MAEIWSTSEVLRQVVFVNIFAFCRKDHTSKVEVASVMKSEVSVLIFKCLCVGNLLTPKHAGGGGGCVNVLFCVCNISFVKV